MHSDHSGTLGNLFGRLIVISDRLSRNQKRARELTETCPARSLATQSAIAYNDMIGVLSPLIHQLTSLDGMLAMAIEAQGEYENKCADETEALNARLYRLQQIEASAIQVIRVRDEVDREGSPLTHILPELADLHKALTDNEENNDER